MNQYSTLRLAFGFAFLLFLVQCQTTTAVESRPVQFDPTQVPYPRLSDYAFFEGNMATLDGNTGVLPYELITPLFTDYAHKKRFVWMPGGAQAQVDEAGEIQFPDQTVLIKNFYYPADFRKASDNWDIIETRLLIKLDGKWEAHSYVWNEEQTDAKLTLIGAFKTVSWTDLAGAQQTIEYVVPNKNQCKSCHNRHNELLPIGPKVRNLNQSFQYEDGTVANQIQAWQAAGFLPAGAIASEHPPLADWNDPAAHTVSERALAYLDVNCGHCHQAAGPAHTTGLYLTAYQENPTQLGIHKPPVAAGKGSGGRKYGIEPGQPDASILVYRMESDDPGVMMPEVGRVLPHQEGIALIREWIASMD
ncbi:MAG: SO2930 family diheme c-type cytochrome [Bacteroidota bacterium]